MPVVRGLPPILYEDESLIAFDKPSGLLTAPDRWEKSRDNLMALIHAKISPEYFNAHRLDADTSGILLCAKNKQTLKPLCALFESRDIEKDYIALVHGAPQEDRGIVNLSLAPDPSQPGRMVVNRQGRHAETGFEVLQRWRGYSQLRLHPLTGRTHQLRVHMAAIQCPILADRFYAQGRSLYLSHIKPGYKFKRGRDERPLVRHLALHSQRLRFLHPVTGAEVEITSPLPHEFLVAIKYLDLFAGGRGKGGRE